MTDAEIKKALEWHLNEVNHCDECPLFVLKNTTTYCVDVLMQNSLDLINRQEQELRKSEKVERLADKTIATLNAENQSLKAEVERLKEEVKKEQLYNLRMTAHNIKAEAYKEFAERLREKTKWLFSSVSINNEIDNLLNELVGGSDG